MSDAISSYGRNHQQNGCRSHSGEMNGYNHSQPAEQVYAPLTSILPPGSQGAQLLQHIEAYLVDRGCDLFAADVQDQVLRQRFNAQHMTIASLSCTIEKLEKERDCFAKQAQQDQAARTKSSRALEADLTHLRSEIKGLNGRNSRLVAQLKESQAECNKLRRFQAERRVHKSARPGMTDMQMYKQSESQRSRFSDLKENGSSTLPFPYLHYGDDVTHSSSYGATVKHSSPYMTGANTTEVDPSRRRPSDLYIHEQRALLMDLAGSMDAPGYKPLHPVSDKVVAAEIDNTGRLSPRPFAMQSEAPVKVERDVETEVQKRVRSASEDLLAIGEPEAKRPCGEGMILPERP